MIIRKLLFFSLVVSMAVVSGCRTGLLNGDQASDAPPAPQAPPPPVVVDGVRTSYADVVERTAPAVVQIEAEVRNNTQREQVSPFGDDLFRQFQLPQPNQRPRVQRGVGSGVIVSADGTILTNAHVIDGAEKITVILQDDRSFEAKLVGSDKPSDLAVLKIDAQNMPYLTLGNSDTVRVGDIVLAIGNPLGIGQSVTAGIISAKGRRTGLSDGQSFEDFLQTDAPINRGNSGGALVNLAGELIGINSQILAGGPTGGNIGIGFAIPTNMARSVLEQLLQNGRVRRGMLGVGIQNLTADTAAALDLKDTRGVLVSSVRPGSAADKAGIRRGDVITAINGEPVEDGNVLRNRVAGTLPGSEVRVTVLRDGSSQEVSVTLDEFELAQNTQGGQLPGGQAVPNSQTENGRLGLSLQPVTPQVARQLGLSSENEGLVVTDIDPNGAAAEAGIARGDVILEVNRQPVNSTDAVQGALDRSGDRPILLLVSRRGQTTYLTVRPS